MSTFVSATSSSANTTTYASAAFSPAVGDVLLGIVSASATVDIFPTMTDSTGEAVFTCWMQAGSNTAANSIYICAGDTKTTSTTSRTLTFGCPNDAATGAVISIYRLSGMTHTGTGAIKQIAWEQAKTTGGTPAPVFPYAVTSTNPVIAFASNATNPAGITQPTGFALDAGGGTNAYFATPTIGTISSSIDSGSTSTTLTFGSTSASAYGDVALEIDASAAPSGVYLAGTCQPANLASGTSFTVPCHGVVAGQIISVGGWIHGGTALSPAPVCTDGSSTYSTIVFGTDAAGGQAFECHTLSAVPSGDVTITVSWTVTAQYGVGFGAVIAGASALDQGAGGLISSTASWVWPSVVNTATGITLGFGGNVSASGTYIPTGGYLLVGSFTDDNGQDGVMVYKLTSSGSQAPTATRSAASDGTVYTVSFK
ncbi:MAG: hypothetical protein LAP40_05030 [Acidobacteriia bacterium]|nr:hypothetical protein [Terriglobia bacterium]